MTDQILLPGISDEDNALLKRLLEQLAQTEPRNTLRTAYYDGKRVARHISTIVPPIYHRLGVVLGWSAKAVDVLSRRCNLDSLVWADGDLASIGYDEVWDGNQFGAEMSSAMTSSLLYGPTFLVNTQGDASKGEVAGLIHVKDAMSATGDWNPRTRRMDNLLSLTGVDQNGITSFALYLDGRTITAVKTDGVWTADQVTHKYGVPVEMMAYKPRVGQPFGQSRISRPIISLHDAALRTCMRLEGHADVYSYPEMWLLGADESIFKNADGSTKQAWQIMLGRIKAIPDDDEATNPRADVKQFNASSPQPHIDQLKWQAETFAGEASIPVISLGVADTHNPSSADAIAESRADLISEAEGACDDWSVPMRRAFIRGLAMANNVSVIPPEWKTISSKFRNPLYISRAAAADAGQKSIAAIPWLAETSVGLELLGLDEQQIQRAMAEKRKAQGTLALAALQAAAAARAAAPPAPAPVPSPAVSEPATAVSPAPAPEVPAK